jgi:putative membrane protein
MPPIEIANRTSGGARGIPSVGTRGSLGKLFYVMAGFQHQRDRVSEQGPSDRKRQGAVVYHAHNMHGDFVLRRFSLSEGDLLGSGGESQVYAMNERSVLRVYGAGTDPAYVERLRGFYADAGDQRLPFELPVMEDVGIIDDALYSIERRVQGTSMTEYLLTAQGDARERSLESYFSAAEYIRTVPMDQEEFGELLVSEPVRRREWPEFLLARAQQTLLRSYSEFSAEVPGLAEVIASWEGDLRRLGDVTKPKLVHGDYFPGNILVNERGEVTAVIDFSPLTVAGDPRMDLVGALIFLEVDDGYQPGDSDIALRLLAERLGSGVPELIGVYRTYYSLYFSACKDDDPSLYSWCIGNLRHAS